MSNIGIESKTTSCPNRMVIAEPRHSICGCTGRECKPDLPCQYPPYQDVVTTPRLQTIKN